MSSDVIYARKHKPEVSTNIKAQIMWQAFFHNNKDLLPCLAHGYDFIWNECEQNECKQNECKKNKIVLGGGNAHL